MTELMDHMLRRALRFEAHKALVADVKWLLQQPEKSFCWRSTQRDLVEYAHLAWQSNEFFTMLGSPMSRTALARRIFAVVGRRAPAKLTPIVAQLQLRQDDRNSLISRYMATGSHPGYIRKLMKRREDQEDLTEFLDRHDKLDLSYPLSDYYLEPYEP